MNKQIELAKKLKALADRGIGGEKLNAEKMLQGLMSKHKITFADINGEDLVEAVFNVKPDEYRMWRQIIGRVNPAITVYGAFPKSAQKKFNLAGNYMIKCTYSENIEVEAMFNFYKELYKKEEDLFFHSFCLANNLLVDAKKSDAPPSSEDIDKWFKIEALASNIDKKNYRKQISEKK